jgi:pimeloyl-ACP methyl ester carboxylesterase
LSNFKCYWRANLLRIAVIFIPLACVSCSIGGNPKIEALVKKNYENTLFFESVDGTRIAYKVIGKGTPIVLMHGFFADFESNWMRNEIAQTLSKEYQVIMYDHRGHGRSDKHYIPSKYGDFMWRDALALLDHLRIKKAHFHGYSMGGEILTQILFHAPHRVVTATYGGAGIYEFQTPEAIPKDTKGLEGPENAARNHLIETVEHSYLAAIVLRIDPPWEQHEQNGIDLKTLNVPVLAVVGEYDQPNFKTFRMGRELPNFTKEVVDGSGHLTLITDPGAVAQYIAVFRRFLKRHDR